jgi:acyl-CoA thioester hydrolase
MNRLEPPGRSEFCRFVSITTRWMDNDAYRHLNNVVYYSLFDTAVNQLLIEHGLLDIDASPAIGLVVETQCQYFSSIAFPDRVQVGIRVTEIGRSSVCYALGIFRNEEKAAAAAGRFVHVYVSRESRKPTEISAGLRETKETILYRVIRSQ